MYLTFLNSVTFNLSGAGYFWLEVLKIKTSFFWGHPVHIDVVTRLSLESGQDSESSIRGPASAKPNLRLTRNVTTHVRNGCGQDFTRSQAQQVFWKRSALLQKGLFFHGIFKLFRSILKKVGVIGN